MIQNQYPIGKYEPQPFSQNQLGEWLGDIEWLPSQLEIAVQNFDLEDLETPYRVGGWSVQQLVHHIADSHINAFIRFKLGLTEHNPTIKPYDENAWAHLGDTETTPINISLTLLHALHKRWYQLLRLMKEEDFTRAIIHPDHPQPISLWNLLGQYAWHGKHHLAQIKNSKVYQKING